MRGKFIKMKLLEGKKALVTGSSRGIGCAIAKDLAANGAFVYVHYVNSADKAKAVADEIIANGGKADIVRADLTDQNSTDGLIESIGGVDILVLNASLQIREKWDVITKEHFYSQITCNLLSSMLLIQQAVPHMKQQHWGRIITIGSVQEAKPHPDMLVYSASKSAQTTMAKSLALQLAEYNITVNNVAPGVIYTDRNVKALSDPDYAKSVTDSIPLRFYGEPRDIAGAVRLLCTEEGRYITGQSIFVDGGKSVQ